MRYPLLFYLINDVCSVTMYSVLHHPLMFIYPINNFEKKNAFSACMILMKIRGMKIFVSVFNNTLRSWEKQFPEVETKTDLFSFSFHRAVMIEI